jgi:hypothetical protein
MSISLDGFITGPNDGVELPLARAASGSMRPCYSVEAEGCSRTRAPSR